MGTGSAKRKRRIALLVQYDGTLFNGFQHQDAGRTVQGELEKAVCILAKENVRISSAGRTDAGVHALGQVVHFNTSSDIPLQRLCIGMNGIMEKDISVINAYNVTTQFHSRFSAIEREYIYRIYTSPLRSPFMTYRAAWVSTSIDPEYLKKASAHLTGELDFASFCKKRSSEDINTFRNIRSFEVEKEGDYITLRIRGNAFLHNMIRIIAGTLMEMAKENRDPDSILEVLAAKNREAAGPTAPPYGLYFASVDYDPPLSTYESAY